VCLAATVVYLLWKKHVCVHVCSVAATASSFCLHRVCRILECWISHQLISDLFLSENASKIPLSPHAAAKIV